MNELLIAAVSTFDASAKRKLSNAAAQGVPEDQLRAPFERRVLDIARATNFADGSVTPVGETSLAEARSGAAHAAPVAAIGTPQLPMF